MMTTMTKMRRRTRPHSRVRPLAAAQATHHQAASPPEVAPRSARNPEVVLPLETNRIPLPSPVRPSALDQTNLRSPARPSVRNLAVVPALVTSQMSLPSPAQLSAQSQMSLPSLAQFLVRNLAPVRPSVRNRTSLRNRVRPSEQSRVPHPHQATDPEPRPQNPAHLLAAV